MVGFRFVLAIVIVIICASFPALSSAATVTPPSYIEKQMLKKINTYRSSHGVAPMRFEARLQRTARWMSLDMIRYDYFGHNDHLNRDPFARLTFFGYTNRSIRGENIAAGNNDVNNTFKQWVNSPPHRKNMLNSKYKYSGIARVCDETSTYHCYWSHEFGGHFSLGF